MSSSGVYPKGKPSNGPANAREFFSDPDAARRTWCNQGNRRAIEADIKSPGRRVRLAKEPKGYLDLHMLNVSRKKALSIR